MYRICYLKSAFDGESKLQILNGNYRIPELPKYCSSITSLIKEMLQSSPDARPDITQARALLDWPFTSMNLGWSQCIWPNQPSISLILMHVLSQVWFRVNELLPLELQKDLPDGSPSGSAFELQTTEDEGLASSILPFLRIEAAAVSMVSYFHVTSYVYVQKDQ